MTYHNQVDGGKDIGYKSHYLITLHIISSDLLPSRCKRNGSRLYVNLDIGVHPQVPGERDIEISEPHKLTFVRLHRLKCLQVLLIPQNEGRHRMRVRITRYSRGKEFRIPISKHANDEEFELLREEVSVNVNFCEGYRDERGVFEREGNRNKGV